MNPWRLAPILGLLALSPEAARADASPNVLVGTVTPHEGSLPEIVTAWGEARPALDSATTLSQQIDGQVTAIAVTPGEAVRSGQRLLDFRPSPAAVSLYRQAVTALEAARATRVRTAQLLASRLATRDQLAQADTAVADAGAALDALRRQGGGGGNITVTAPFDGIVDTIPVVQGVRIAPGMPLLTLTARNGLVVTVGIDPADHARVAAGQTVDLSRLSGGDTLAGRVLRVDGVLNPRTRLVDVDISVPTNAVLSGEAFMAQILIAQAHGWLVPHDSVLADEHGAWVFQISQGHGVRVDIVVEVSGGETDLVTGGIDPGRPLVTDGNWQLEDGMAVRSGSAP